MKLVCTGGPSYLTFIDTACSETARLEQTFIEKDDWNFSSSQFSFSSTLNFTFIYKYNH